MKDKENAIKIINELILVNEDRSNAYDNLSSTMNSEDFDLTCVFRNFALNSKRYANLLKESLRKMGGIKETPSLTDNIISRAIVSIKGAFKGADKQAILTSCESGERATLTVFHDVLKDATGLPNEIRELIHSQEEMLRKAYAYINEYRNSLIQSFIPSSTLAKA